MRRMLTPRRRRLWAGRAAALVPGFIIASYLANGYVPVAMRLEALAVLLASLSCPAFGLMLVALLAPLGDIVVPLLGTLPLHHAETLVLAFLAAWLSERGAGNESPRQLPAALVSAMWVFGGVLITSVVGTALQLYQENPAELQRTLVTLSQSYLLTDDVIGAHAAAPLLEGLGLLAATALLTDRVRERFWLRVCLVAAGVVAAVASGLLVFHIAPMIALVRHAAIGTRRYSAIVGDVNATASLYVLLAGVSAGAAAAARRTRAAWLAAAATLLAGLALTGSGAGIIAGAVVCSAAVMLWIAFAATPLWKAAGALLVVLVATGAITIARTPHATGSLEMRVGFTHASMRLIEARPVLGVGVGRYYALSKVVLAPGLSWAYGRENAHDFYLQILAELGIVGAAAFLWVMGAALTAPLARVWRGRADAVTVGCAGGVVAYLVTALAGHPFLVPEAVMPFWIVMGLLVAPQTGRPVRSSRLREAAIAFACAFLLTALVRGAVPRVRLPTGEDGLGPPRTDHAGRPFREAGPVVSLFVGPTVTVVEIPVRLEDDRRGGWAIVHASVLGAYGSDLRLGPDWTILEIPLPANEPLVPFQRINLAITRSGGDAAAPTPVVDVGQLKLVVAK